MSYQQSNANVSQIGEGVYSIYYNDPIGDIIDSTAFNLFML